MYTHTQQYFCQSCYENEYILTFFTIAITFCLIVAYIIRRGRASMYLLLGFRSAFRTESTVTLVWIFCNIPGSDVELPK